MTKKEIDKLLEDLRSMVFFKIMPRPMTQEQKKWYDECEWDKELRAILEGSKIQYICDTKRHLVCIPYSVENLHKMAEDLNIDKCWFHKNHYDIPKKRIEEIMNKCMIISSKEIVQIIKSTTNGQTDLFYRCVLKRFWTKERA